MTAEALYIETIRGDRFVIPLTSVREIQLVLIDGDEKVYRIFPNHGIAYHEARHFVPCENMLEAIAHLQKRSDT